MPRTPKPNLSYLQDNVYFRFRKAQVRAMETVREGVLHVSDVISPCMRMVHYKKTDPQPSMTTESMRALYMGQIIHAHSMLSDNKKHHEIKLAYDLRFFNRLYSWIFINFGHWSTKLICS